MELGLFYMILTIVAIALFSSAVIALCEWKVKCRKDKKEDYERSKKYLKTYRDNLTIGSLVLYNGKEYEIENLYPKSDFVKLRNVENGRHSAADINNVYPVDYES